MSLYLDASAILPVLVEEGASRAVSRFLSDATDVLVVSDFAAAEVASAFSRLTRMGSLPVEAATRHLNDFDAWRAAFTIDVDIQASDVRLANVFVRRFELGLRAPDALHTAICRRCDYILVTLDQRRALAAGALGVAVQIAA